MHCWVDLQSVHGFRSYDNIAGFIISYFYCYSTFVRCLLVCVCVCVFVCVLVCFSLCVVIIVFFLIVVFTYSAARVFNKLTRYSLLGGLV